MTGGSDAAHSAGNGGQHDGRPAPGLRRDAIRASRSPPVGPLAAAMHRPDLAEKWSELGLVLRFNSSFPPRLREFVILLTGRFWDCQFEWFSHEAEARKAGLSDASIETLRAGGSR